jgi:DNA-binding MarR family transcriptional regulator
MPTIRLTAQGEQFLGQLWGIVESSEAKIFQNFTEQERQQFTTYLKRIQTNCEQIISDSVIVR